MNGGDVWDTWFFRGGGIGGSGGYNAAEVDDLLRRVAAEFDAGRPVGPLIGSVSFHVTRRGYDIDSVDWFLGQLLRHSGPGHDFGDVAQLSRNAPGYFTEECWNAWHGFGHQPGTQLWWRQAGWHCELRTAEQQNIASLRGFALQGRGYGWPMAISVGGRRFAFKKLDAPQSSSTGISEIAARSTRDIVGHFAGEGTSRRKREVETSDPKPIQVNPLAEPREFVDETGTPILYVSGQNYDHRASACITFCDWRWLRFLVRGTIPGNAIMTAVDQAGNSVVRYRISQNAKRTVEITVDPNRELTDELVLAIAISAPWLGRYFKRESGGG